MELVKANNKFGIFWQYILYSYPYNSIRDWKKLNEGAPTPPTKVPTFCVQLLYDPVNIEMNKMLSGLMEHCEPKLSTYGKMYFRLGEHDSNYFQVWFEYNPKIPKIENDALSYFEDAFQFAQEVASKPSDNGFWEIGKTKFEKYNRTVSCEAVFRTFGEEVLLQTIDTEDCSDERSVPVVPQQKVDPEAFDELFAGEL